MCGSSAQQNQINASQINYMNTLTSQYSTEFGQNQAILATLTSTLSPIVAAGPSQAGYSPTELAALNAQATESTAAGYRSAATAEGERQATLGGGNSPFTSAAQEQLQSGLMTSATNELTNQKTGILSNDYATGRANFQAATGALEGASGSQENPLSTAAGEVNNSGTAAANEANSINAADNSWMGLLGGVASAAVGGLASGGIKIGGGGGGGSQSGNGMIP